MLFWVFEGRNIQMVIHNLLKALVERATCFFFLLLRQEALYDWLDNPSNV